MANNRIQIKRSATTATPTSLLPGELAFSNVTGGSGVLFIGDTSNSAVVAIGGVRNPGTLTANQALVANSTSAINQVIVGNLAFTGTTQNILANGSVGTAGFVLSSGGTGSNVYWVSSGSLGVNTNAQYVWTNTHTFQNTVTFGANLIVDTTSLRWVGNPTTSPTITLANTGSFTIGNSSTTQTTGQILVQNTAGLTTINAGSIQTTTVFANVSGTTGTFTGLVNASALNVVNQTNTATLFVTTSANVGTAFTVTGSQVTTAVNTSLSSGALTTNSTVINGTVYVNATGFSTTGNANAGTIFVTGSVNATTVNTTSVYATGLVNAANFSTTGNANATNYYAGPNTVLNATNLLWTGNPTTSPTITLANTGSFTIGNGSTTQTTSKIDIANSTGNVVITPGTVSINATGSVNASSFRVGTNFIANSTQLTISGTPLSANGGVGSQAQVLASNGATGSPYWTTAAVGTITGVTAGNGLTGGGASGAVTLDVGAGNGIAVAADTVSVTGANGIVVTSGGVSVNAGSTLTVNSVGLHVNNTLSIQDLTLSGNLTINGTLTTIDTTNLVVNDSIISLARNNGADSLDIGFYGQYNDGTERFTGLIHDTSTDTYELFANTTVEPTTTLDIGGTGYTTARLKAFLTSGGLTTNSTSANLVANSTYTVGVIANSIFLSGRANNDLLFSNSTGGITGLALNTIGGYVVQSNGTAIVYDYLDGGTF